MFKKITQKINKVFISTLILTSVLSGSVFALTANEDPNNIKTLLVSDDSYRNWKPSMTINPDNTNTVAFNIHYYAWHEGATNMRAKMDNLNGRVFNPGTYTIKGSVWSDNLSTSNGSVSVTFTKKVKLRLFYTSDQKNSCKSRSCQSGSAPGVLSGGQNVGNFPVRNNSNYHGNVVVVYMLESIEDTSRDGGWTTWNLTNTSAYGSCVNGTETRTKTYSRTCTNPTPLGNGADCSNLDGGNSTKTETQSRTCTVNNQEADVTTMSAYSIDTTCATLKGSVDLNDENSEVVKFKYGTSSSNLNDHVTVRTMNSNGTFTKRICGLNPDTRYYFRAYSDSSTGNLEDFKTDPEVTINGDVDTNAPSSITRTSVRLNGDTDGTDVNDVWFAFSRTDSTPLCNSSSQRVEATGNNNFYKYKRNLTCNTTYYYRACGLNSNDDIISGNVKEFQTLACEVNHVEAQVSTQNATKIRTTTAQLNGYVDINDTENGRVYFVYGTSSSNMNMKTGKSSVITDNTSFQSIVGLTPNTRYYFQAIIRDNNGIVDRGVVRTFVTNSNGTVVTPINGKCSTFTKERCVRGNWTHVRDSSTQYKWRCNGINGGSSVSCTLNKPTTHNPRPVVIPTPRPIEVVVVNETTTIVEKNYEEKGLKINKTVSTEKFGTYGLSTTAKIGDKIYYKIRVKNNSNKTIEDVEVKDFIPAELDMNDNSTSNVEKFATYIINLQPGQSKTVLTEMILSDNVSEGDIIDSAAQITMDGITEDTNSVSISVIAEDVLDDNGDGQTASIFGANSDFFPSSIIGWMILLILALGIGLLVTRIFTAIPNKRD